MAKTINTKELRASMPEVVRRVRQGERFTVLYRSRPAFRLVPIDESDDATSPPLEEDPLFGAPPVGRSTDGASSRDHDAMLYGPPRR